ncbi:hypothetical protein LCGC14_0877540 [marine sediment metagenome]|uniref:Uncharacterized protein n=1 Tax=marine sediment metagenome TaxID=412755 RepID=A0A0F9S9U6_9ZZZZ
MSYVQHADAYRDPTLDGFFSAIGGAFKKAGGFVAKKVVPVALTAVPVVGGAAASAYSQIPGIRQRAPVWSGDRPALAPAPTAPSVPWWQRAAQAAAERIGEDPGFRERAVSYTARYAPSSLLAAAAARQAREAPTAVKAGMTVATLLPAVALAALVLRKRK